MRYTRLVLRLRWLAVLYFAALLAPVRVLAAPGDILYSDNFERATLAPWTTTDASRSGILTGPQVSSSPTRGAFTRNDPVTITGPSFSAAVPAAQVSYWVRRGDDAFSEDPDQNEDFVLEYRRSNGSWAQIAFFVGEGTPGQIYQETVILPPDALHGSLAIRASQLGGNGTNWDYWHLDDIVVTEISTAPPINIATVVNMVNKTVRLSNHECQPSPANLFLLITFKGAASTNSSSTTEPALAVL